MKNVVLKYKLISIHQDHLIFFHEVDNCMFTYALGISDG